VAEFVENEIDPLNLRRLRFGASGWLQTERPAKHE
jgi:hypothetical protein